MCGICGVYGSSNTKKIEQMTVTLSHRGPDSYHTEIVGGRHSLGGARLHITGAFDTPYPYCRTDEGVHVLLNGEIYNYQYWQKKLENEGYSFNTGTDTEIVWALYKKFGPNFIQQLKGMFAIAVLDGDKLILARDPMGIKPIYYCVKGEQLAFASEIKALLRFTNTQPVLNISALQEIITFGYIYSTEVTLFEGINQVKPGEVLTFSGKEIYTEQYFSPPQAISSPIEEDEYRRHKLTLSKLLPAAMESILNHGEQEKGVFLSGGVDSSLTALLGKEVAGGIKTFTLTDGPQSPDLPWARKVAKAIKSDHYEFSVTLRDYLAELPRFVYHYENLVAGGVFDLQGGIAFQLLCKEASRHVKVALTGEGADELFGGYYWTYTHPLGFADRLQQRLQQATQYVPNENLQDIVNRLFPLPEDEMQYRLNLFDALIQGGLSNYHLWSVDRSSGTFGFEIRPFYLYDDIVHMALNLPVQCKAPSPGVTKLLLKDVANTFFSRYGLDELVNRKKFGMPAALSQLDAQVKNYINDYVSDKHLSNHPYRQFLSCKTDIFMFDIFFYIFIKNSGVFDPAFNLNEALAGGIFENMYN